MCKRFLTKDYLTCNHGKCCEFCVICPCIVRKVQSLWHLLYVSWSSLDGLLVCLLWCGFSEFRMIRGSCGRIARNLVDSLHFSWVLCRWSKIWNLTRHGLIYCEMRGIRVIRVIGGRIERNLVDSLQFSWVLCRRSEIWKSITYVLIIVRSVRNSHDSRAVWANRAESA